MSERDAFVNGQSLDLVEDGQMRGVVLVRPVDAAGTDDVDRQSRVKRARTCTGEVWVRKTMPPSSGSTNKVSVMVRAG